MNDLDLNALLAVALGLGARFGLPLLFTGLAAWGLRVLDRRWQSQAEHARPILLGIGAAPAETRCWETMDCPQDARQGCPAYGRPQAACWQVFRELTGLLPERCLGCDVFLSAPVRL